MRMNRRRRYPLQTSRIRYHACNVGRMGLCPSFRQTAPGIAFSAKAVLVVSAVTKVTVLRLHFLGVSNVALTSVHAWLSLHSMP